MMEESELTELNHAQRIVRAALVKNGPVLREYLEHGMISRETPPDHERNATCTAFSLYYLAVSNLLGGADSPTRPLKASEERTALHALGTELAHLYAKRGRRAASHPTSTGALPNQYNTAIQMAGYLTASTLLNVPVPTSLNRLTKTLITWLARHVMQQRRGWAARLDAPVPSAYLTFWCNAAFKAWLESPARSPKLAAEVEAALDATHVWATQAIANALAYHHAAMRSRVDVVESMYAVLCVGVTRRGVEAMELARRAIAVAFSEYFDNGTFAPSAPVLADKHNFSLQCPTAEVSALLIGITPSILFDQWRPLMSVFGWLDRHARPDGWSPEHTAQHQRPTGFMTSSALAFMATFINLLDDALHRGAANLLGVSNDMAKAPEHFQYPRELGDVLNGHVLKPLVAQPRRTDLASYSMILFGPPGTSKTTIAKRLAADLSWPLFIVNQNAFLQRGVSHIDAEAERIFRLVSYLKNVVVLFDEVEELVEARHPEERPTSDKVSRILTTSMLPRIHELRDLRRIVFIFATNYVSSIDDAATRLGRFDIVRAVMPPNMAERRKLLRQATTALGASSAIVAALKDARVVQSAKNFCYVDLHALVRHLKVKEEIEGETVTTAMVDEALAIYRRRVESKAFQASLRQAESDALQYSRP